MKFTNGWASKSPVHECAVEQLAISRGNVKDPTQAVVEFDILTALPEGVVRKT
ncbi:MAG: hypothetical protein WBA20_12680 [Ketobacter sp.]